MTHTHICWNGRRYGMPGSHGSSARHAATEVTPGRSYRTLCGRKWDDGECETGGDVEHISHGRKVTCKRCLVELEQA